MVELLAATMGPKDNVKDFNQFFTTIINKFQQETTSSQELQIKFYVNSLLISNSMFAKNVSKHSLEEKFEEAKTMEFHMKGFKEIQICLE